MQILSKRIPTIIALILLVVAMGGGWWYLNKERPVATADEKPQAVRVTNVADNKFSVTWTTSGVTVGEIEWGVAGEKLSHLASDDRDTTKEPQKYQTHHITISELQPSTQYVFRIISGEKKVRFDDNGSPYKVQTGPSIAITPPAHSFYGQVETETGQPLGGAIVYLLIPGAAPVSVLTKSSGGYSLSLSTIRAADLTKYVSYDPKATVVGVTVTTGKVESSASVATANAAPAPTIVMGRDNTLPAKEPQVAQVEEASQEAKTVQTGETPTVFNVEPLGEVPGESGQVILLSPTEEGETVATDRPEIFGVGPAQTVISITLHSATPYSDTVVVDSAGEWAWTPPANLEPGEHTLTIAYVDLAGLERVITRNFVVQPALAEEPAFEATPSASTTPTPKPSATATFKPSPTPQIDVNSQATPAASPREVIPSTESGVPVSGVMTPTVLTVMLGFVIMVVGALLVAL